MTKSICGFVSVLVLGFASASSAQSTLIADINRGAGSEDRGVRSNVAPFQGHLYFAGRQERDADFKLWRSTGLAESSQVVVSGDPAFTGRNVGGLTVVGDRLCFFQEESDRSHSLWSFDGSTFRRLLDRQYLYSANVNQVEGGFVFYASPNVVDDDEDASPYTYETGTAWFSDCTSERTFSLESQSEDDGFVNYAGHDPNTGSLYFTWRTRPSSNGPYHTFGRDGVYEIAAGAAAATPVNFDLVSSANWFKKQLILIGSRDDGRFMDALDLQSGVVDELLEGYPNNDCLIFRQSVLGGSQFLYTKTDRQLDSTPKCQLWISDGDTSTLLSTIPAVYHGTDFQILADLGDRFLVGTFFNWRNDYSGPEEWDRSIALWSSDGTNEGTEQLLDLSEVRMTRSAFSVHDGKAWFYIGNDNRNRLWSTDGTRENTRPSAHRYREQMELRTSYQVEVFGRDYREIKNLASAPIVALNDQLFSVAPGKRSRREVWRVEPVSQEISALGQWTPDSRPAGFSVSGKRMWFYAKPRSHYDRYWLYQAKFSNGVEGSDSQFELTRVRRLGQACGGTLQIGSRVLYTKLVELGDFGFGAFDGIVWRCEVWASDLTGSNPQQLSSATRNAPSDFFKLNATTACYAHSGSNTSQLLCSDGTQRGTRVVKSGSSPRERALTKHKGQLWFIRVSADGKTRLYQSDGTASGTRATYEFNDGDSVLDLASAGGSLVFVRQTATNRIQYWQGDGRTFTRVALGPAQTTVVGHSNAYDSSYVQYVQFGRRYLQKSGGKLHLQFATATSIQVHAFDPSTSTLSLVAQVSKQECGDRVQVSSFKTGHFYACDGRVMKAGEPGAQPQVLAESLQSDQLFIEHRGKLILRGDDGTTGIELHALDVPPSQ